VAYDSRNRKKKVGRYVVNLLSFSILFTNNSLEILTSRISYIGSFSLIYCDAEIILLITFSEYCAFLKEQGLAKRGFGWRG
jgi:hypothetical protein